MDKVTAKMEKRRQKVYIRAYLLLCVVLLAVMGFYTYSQFVEYRLVSQGAEKSESLSGFLRTKVPEVRAEYEENKELFDRLDRVLSQNLERVFPPEDDYTGLTRQLDSFEESISRSGSPFEVSNIEFQNVIERDNYKILPLRMNIRSSSENFTKFLQMVENSGAIDGDIRLMSVSSIRLSFQGSPIADPSEIINFSVQLNAYFQK